MNEKFVEFREKFPEFVFEKYEYNINKNELFVKFYFDIPDLASFSPEWIFNVDCAENVDINSLENMIFSLGMTELISYWKAVCSPKITVKCGFLSDQQISWWEKLFRKGLGEFFYKNEISFDENSLFKITSNPLVKPKVCKKLPLNNKVLIPIGGGKDSVVTLELLKEISDRTCFIINPRKATLDTVSCSGISKLITAKRTIDKNLLSLNSQGFLNGHTPFSAIVAFSSVIAAHLAGISYVCLSNESSANDPTVSGTDVNHQYSKSFEFEQDFSHYLSHYLSTNISYFSMLRPYNELKIASIFAKFEQYHEIFQSCNAGSKTNVWCLNCSKCLFVFIILSPFLSVFDLTRIFGKNLLDDLALLEDFKKLVGLTPEKPFECVGSCDEINCAIQYLLTKYEYNVNNSPALLKFYIENYKGEKFVISDFLDYFDENNLVPQQFLPALI